MCNSLKIRELDDLEAFGLNAYHLSADELCEEDVDWRWSGRWMQTDGQFDLKSRILLILKVSKRLVADSGQTLANGRSIGKLRKRCFLCVRNDSESDLAAE